MRIIQVFLIWIASSAILAGEVQLVGKNKNILVDEVKEVYITNTIERLLASCTTKIEIPSIPKSEYKGVRVKISNGQTVEAHIFLESKKSYMVKIYTQENGKTYLHGKYVDYAYQLISMLEVQI